MFEAQPAILTIGGAVYTPNGTIKSPFVLTTSVPRKKRRRFIPLPCELAHETATRNVLADALVDLFDQGTAESEGRIRLFTAGGITLLSTILMANPAFGSAVSGVASGNSLPWTDLSAVGSGTAAEFIAYDRDETPILSGDVSLSGDEVSVNDTEIAVNDIVKLLTVSYTAPP